MITQPLTPADSSNRALLLTSLGKAAPEALALRLLAWDLWNSDSSISKLLPVCSSEGCLPFWTY